jgi:GTPase
MKGNSAAYDFYTLGVDHVIPISAIHGLGVGDLLDEVVTAFKDHPDLTEDADEDIMKIAIVGRPNVGKSSMLNRLIGEDRVIVSPIAGTTRDAIDTRLTWNNQEVMLVDTAGMRRRGKIEPGVEQFSVMRALRALERCDVALLMVDAADGVTEQDEHIAGYILEAHKSVVIVVNKWDLLEKDNQTYLDFMEQVRTKLHFLDYAPMIFVSVKTGQRIHQVLETAHRVWDARFFRVATHQLNTIVRDALEEHIPMLRHGKKLKFYYGTQVNVNPPVFLMHVNDTEIHFGYKRFLENKIRASFPFEGTPIRISFRESE